MGRQGHAFAFGARHLYRSALAQLGHHSGGTPSVSLVVAAIQRWEHDYEAPIVWQERTPGGHSWPSPGLSNLWKVFVIAPGFSRRTPASSLVPDYVGRKSAEPLDYRRARIRQCRTSPSHLASAARNHLCASFPRSPDHLFPSFGSKLAIQRRYTERRFLCTPYGYLQGITVRPVPCNYNVIQSVSALSRPQQGLQRGLSRVVGALHYS